MKMIRPRCTLGVTISQSPQGFGRDLDGGKESYTVLGAV